MMHDDFSQFSMRDLFRMEAEGQTQALTAALLDLEKDAARPDLLEASMRAAHSLKGAARIVEIQPAVTVAHAMEDLFVLAQEGKFHLDQPKIDMLLRGVDLLSGFAGSPHLESGAHDAEWQAEADRFCLDLAQREAAPGSFAEARPADQTVSAHDPAEELLPVSEPMSAGAPLFAAERTNFAPADRSSETPAAATPTAAIGRQLSGDDDGAERALRVSAESLNRLLDLAGESLVESRWLRPFGQSLVRLKRMQQDAAGALEALEVALAPQLLGDAGRRALALARQRMSDCREHLAGRLDELERADQQASVLAHRLYDQALGVRMRPFADGVGAFPRMVRDLGRSLGKEVTLEIVGDRTQIDRDILEKLEAPLGHMLRNALDHGVETPAERLVAGKPAQAVIRLEARHQSGALRIVLSDDGRGIDLERVRRAVVARGLANEETAARLSESELLEFLFLPGFTMKEHVTEISGRGVGLDVVQEMVRQVRGQVRITSRRGEGTQFKLELPLTLSVLRSLLVEIGGEPYAIPLARVVRALKLPTAAVRTLEGRQYVEIDNRAVGLVGAHQVLGCGATEHGDSLLPIILLGNDQELYGLVVDRFLGSRELVVQPLDRRLGKIKDVAAGALTEDGSPLLILDVDDVIRSMEKLSSTDRLATVDAKTEDEPSGGRKRVLVVDDSLTVRELQRKLLEHHGYEVEVAVDGMDGWNALRSGDFALVVSDVDMPRMNGIELLERIRHDPGLKSLPVMIVSYKDRAEDRQRGLDAGADYYLTKASFQSDALIRATIDLIGEAA
ncbi:MAG: hybrid sensor histidine kinase/response regulator [Pseudomonas sp.]|uniref:hybrid sensor histidine kinase/response regulator n=1 Tax=Pseudomonas sp. TaxID=306 RepID=UPI00122991D7|nr:hybrid sensor histidine kinase/response regulator [Pseudomonas sp.]RZI76420.1 MAG: hybrid sensor histidine kinase/response regulator [Pseudomonas sp.]